MPIHKYRRQDIVKWIIDLIKIRKSLKNILVFTEILIKCRK
jgi:hypothetical protein